MKLPKRNRLFLSAFNDAITFSWFNNAPTLTNTVLCILLNHVSMENKVRHTQTHTVYVASIVRTVKTLIFVKCQK